VCVVFRRSRGQDPCLEHKNLGLQSDLASSSPEPRIQVFRIPISILRRFQLHLLQRLQLQASHQINHAFLFLLYAVCMASLFFPLPAAFLPQGFCSEKVFNEVCHFLYITQLSAIFLFIGQCCHCFVCRHVGQFLFPPHASASRVTISRDCISLVYRFLTHSFLMYLYRPASLNRQINQAIDFLRCQVVHAAYQPE